jgi:ABC-type phosphate transport system substrate-binding protein
VKKIALLLALTPLLLEPRPASAQNGRYVVVVNPGNPINRLSATQLSKIYLGKLQGWDINGKIEPVVVVDQKADSPLRKEFTQDVLHRTLTEAESYWRQEIYAGRSFPPPEQSEAEALASVRSAVGGIAYVSVNADLKGVKVVSVR